MMLDMLPSNGLRFRRMDRVCLALAFVLCLLASPSSAERMVAVMQKGSPTVRLYKESDSNIRPKEQIFSHAFWAYQNVIVNGVDAAVSFDGNCQQIPGPNFIKTVDAKYGVISFGTASLPNPYCNNQSMTWSTINYTWIASASDPSSCAVEDPFEVTYPGPGLLGSGILDFRPTADFAPRIMFAAPPQIDYGNPMDITCNGAHGAPNAVAMAIGQEGELTINPAAATGVAVATPASSSNRPTDAPQIGSYTFDPPDPAPVGGYIPTPHSCLPPGCPAPINALFPIVHFIAPGNYNVTYNSSTGPVSATINVSGPVNYAIKPGLNQNKPQVFTEKSCSDYHFGLDKNSVSCTSLALGIDFSTDLQNPEGYVGTYRWVQVVKKYTAAVVEPGRTGWGILNCVNASSPQEWQLDNELPYYTTSGIDTSVQDGPEIKLAPNWTYADIGYEFRMYLQWMPRSKGGMPLLNSIYVTLGYVDWSVNGFAGKGAHATRWGGGSDQAITGGEADEQSFQDDYTYPMWSNLFVNADCNKLRFYN